MEIDNWINIIYINTISIDISETEFQENLLSLTFNNTKKIISLETMFKTIIYIEENVLINCFFIVDLYFDRLYKNSEFKMYFNKTYNILFGKCNVMSGVYEILKQENEKYFEQLKIYHNDALFFINECIKEKIKYIVKKRKERIENGSYNYTNILKDIENLIDKFSC